MALLTEKVKSFFAPHKKSRASSRVNPRNVLNNLSDDNGYLRLTDFFDYQEENYFMPFGEMTQEEKIALLEDMLELDANTLTPETELTTIDEYDSMAKLSLIVLMDEECNKKLTGEQIREFKMVADILNFME